jgi:rubrerythrin
MSEQEPVDLSFGQTVYDADGTELGTVRGFDEHDFYVTFAEGMDTMSAEHVTPGGAGEAELMWRCWECGEMGDIDAVPDGCPACGAARENIYYWVED